MLMNIVRVGKTSIFAVFGGFKKNYQLYQNKNSARVKINNFTYNRNQQKMILVIKCELTELMKIISFAPKHRQ